MDSISSALFLLIGFWILIKSAEQAVNAVVYLSNYFMLSQFTTSFIVVGMASVLPEFSIAMNSAFNGNSSFGLGVLFGSNVADLSIVAGIVVIYAKKIKAQSKIFTDNFYYYLGIISLPVFLLLDGGISQIDGMILLIAFVFYMHLIFRRKKHVIKRYTKFDYSKTSLLKNFSILAISLILLFGSANVVETNSISLALFLGVPNIFVGVIIALGTCLPELTFSLEAIRQKKAELGLGDILGNVATDSTLSIGAVALISPIFPPQMILALFAGFTMLILAALVIYFLEIQKKMIRVEGYLLILLYLIFMASQFVLESSMK
ncbi:sodium:calcium antiporter [Candidatus Micrarchaeota archaeon]|nr:sodium:calcium antiporter [Candidatus Micrarchaeota archaeon]